MVAARVVKTGAEVVMVVARVVKMGVEEVRLVRVSRGTVWVLRRADEATVGAGTQEGTGCVRQDSPTVFSFEYEMMGLVRVTADPWDTTGLRWEASADIKAWDRGLGWRVLETVDNKACDSGL